MKKIYILCVAMLTLFSQAALAAPIGWYQLDATWRDGRFSGQFHYDSSSPYLVTAISGSLVDAARTTVIDNVWNLENAQPESWLFFSNTNPADLGGHDAGFYLTLIDLGASLTLDTSVSNGLFDWSNDAYYNPLQLDDSPLRSFSITQAAAVPEPSSLALLMVGLLVCVLTRRRKHRPADINRTIHADLGKNVVGIIS
jgi:hypothetical protein